MKIIINNDGTMRFIYKDELRDLLKEGESTRMRMSNIEPYGVDEWIVDFKPINRDTILGPFKTREEAIQAEMEWIEENILNGESNIL